MYNKNLIDKAISTWPDWTLGLGRPPKILSELPSGKTNRSYLLEAGSRRLVLRVNNPESHRLGIDRLREKTILEATSKAGISPPLLWCNLDKGLLLTEYREGEHWQPDAIKNRSKRDALLDLMDRIHMLPITLPPFDYEEYAHAYWQQLEDSGRPIPDELQKLYFMIEPLLHELFECLPNPVLCHHDPSPLNLIDSGHRLYMTDWEYSGNGHRIFDQVVLTQLWDLPESEIFDEGLDSDVIELAKLIYQFFDRAWHFLR